MFKEAESRPDRIESTSNNVHEHWKIPNCEFGCLVFIIQFLNMPNLNTFGAQLSDFLPYVEKLENRQKREIGHLKFSCDFPILFDHNLFTDFRWKYVWQKYEIF